MNTTYRTEEHASTRTPNRSPVQHKNRVTAYQRNVANEAKTKASINRRLADAIRRRTEADEMEATAHIDTQEAEKQEHDAEQWFGVRSPATPSGHP